jgi:ribosome biogenesis GTPase A
MKYEQVQGAANKRMKNVMIEGAKNVGRSVRINDYEFDLGMFL